MRFNLPRLHHLFTALILICTSAQVAALPIESRLVSFVTGPTSGAFSFQFAGDGAEFTGLTCATCTLTGLNWTDPAGTAWNSLSQVDAFEALFSTSGQLQSFSLNLFKDFPNHVVGLDGKTYTFGTSHTASLTWSGTSGSAFTGGVRRPGPNCSPTTNLCGQVAGERELPRRAAITDLVVATPEPGTTALLGLALLAAAGVGRRRT